MRKENFKIIVAITSVTQAGLSALVPVLIMGLLAKFLIVKFSFPEITMVIAIVFGVISGFYNMIRYIYLLMKRSGDE